MRPDCDSDEPAEPALLPRGPDCESAEPILMLFNPVCESAELPLCHAMGRAAAGSARGSLSGSSSCFLASDDALDGTS